MPKHIKRTTLILDDFLMADLKKFAAERRQTLSATVDQMLRTGLSQAKSPSRRAASGQLPAFRMGRPRANLADRDQLAQFMDED
jgi:hypothetical protein